MRGEFERDFEIVKFGNFESLSLEKFKICKPTKTFLGFF